MNTKKLTLIALLSALTLMGGCSGSSSATDIQQSSEPEVIHGYTLPPEPNPTINNSTLLGIDSNDNGVRDDVEIWILKKYKDKHPIYTEIAMQAGRAWQKVLEDPRKAKATVVIVHNSLACEGYYQVCAEKYNDIVIENDIINKRFKNKIFNNNNREDAFWEYDKLLSGDNYTVPWCDESKILCDFNTTQYTNN